MIKINKSGCSSTLLVLYCPTIGPGTVLNINRHVKNPFPFLSLQTLFLQVFYQKTSKQKNHCCSQCLSFLSWIMGLFLKILIQILHWENISFISIDNSAKTLGIQWNPTLQPPVNKATSLLRPLYSGLNKAQRLFFLSKKPLSYGQIFGACWWLE